MHENCPQFLVALKVCQTRLIRGYKHKYEYSSDGDSYQPACQYLTGTTFGVTIIPVFPTTTLLYAFPCKPYILLYQIHGMVRSQDP